MISKFASIIILAGALIGCATPSWYSYEGQRYDSKEQFQQAVDSSISSSLSTITPLTAPLTQKKLVFAMPSELTIFNELVKGHVELNRGIQPNASQIEMADNLARATYKTEKQYYDAIQKKNIYGSTQFIEMQSYTGSFAAALDSDVLYWVKPSRGSSGQYYYISLNQGKEIFAWDRSSSTQAGKVQAFLDALQVKAIRP